MLSLLTDEQIETLYVSYINDFLTLESFAEYWGISEDLAYNLIEKGRRNAVYKITNT